MAKRQQNKKTVHYRKPVSTGGTNDPENLSYVKDKHHQAYHLLFANYNPYQVAKILNDKWIDPNYQLIVIEKPQKDKSQLELFK